MNKLANDLLMNYYALDQLVRALSFVMLLSAPSIVNIFFAWSMYKTLKKIPQKFHMLPAWFAWLTLVPFVGYVFYWLMMPFGVPKPIKAYLLSVNCNPRPANTLCILGLLTCTGLIVVPFSGRYAVVLFLIWLSLSVVYWLKLVAIREVGDKNSIVEKVIA